MIEHLFERAFVHRRIGSNYLGIILQDFAVDLCSRGFASTKIRRHVRVAEHFGRWLKRQDVALRNVSVEHVRRFLQRHLPHCRCPKPAPKNRAHCRAAMRRVVEFLRDQQRIKDWAPKAPVLGPVDRLLRDYDRHLEHVCGLADGTRYGRHRGALRFLQWRFRHGPMELRKLQPKDVSAYVLGKAQQLRSTTLHPLRVNLRSFLRFLELSRRIEPRLVGAVPQPSPPVIAPPPQVLEPKQWRRFLDSFCRSTPRGRRDYAIALCLGRLALRSQEVADLTLDDLDWRALTLRLRQTKQRRQRLIPLPDDVALAIKDYLQQGRPPSTSRALFVHHSTPRGRALAGHYVRKLVRHSFTRCGIETTGTHILRHTWATWAHRRGSSLKLIADVLGHRSLAATMRYAQVHLEELRQVALPWPRSDG